MMLTFKTGRMLCRAFDFGFIPVDPSTAFRPNGPRFQSTEITLQAGSVDSCAATAECGAKFGNLLSWKANTLSLIPIVGCVCVCLRVSVSLRLSGMNCSCSEKSTTPMAVRCLLVDV